MSEYRRFKLVLMAGVFAGALHVGAGRSLCASSPREVLQGQYRKALLSGVATVAAPGAGGALSVFGQDAFVVVAGGAEGALREPVVAAATLGKGRVVAFGHESYFKAPALAQKDTGRLILNAVRWAGGKAAAPRIAVRGQGGLPAFLGKHKLKAVALDDAAWTAKLKSFDVLCMRVSSAGAPAGEAVAKFVAAGGGLVVADCGWGWLRLNRGKGLLADHPGNLLLARAGISWGGGRLKPTVQGGYEARGNPPVLCHAGRALEALAAHEAGKAKLAAADVTQATHVVRRMAQCVQLSNALLRGKVERLGKDFGVRLIPTARRPLTDKTPLGRLLMELAVVQMRSLPPERVRAHPAAAAFPGSVGAEAKRVRRELMIDTGIGGWHSTGLYAAPGEVITVQLSPAAAGKRLSVRIGAHKDGLWRHRSWRRSPEVCRAYRIDSPLTRAANAFGGLVYIDVPGGCKLGRVPITVAGAVEAPYFVLGRTDPAAWRKTIRHRPAPWAELATSKVVLTLPSKVVATLDDPTGVMKFWDEVLDACAELVAIPLKRPRPERFVTDVQISAGYMHSGYPIMTQLDMPRVMIDVPLMKREGHGGVWGLFHELGHNHQSRDWTFNGAGEVTVNLLTLYVFDKVCGRPPSAFGRISGKTRTAKIKAYIAGGANFESRWKRDPFLALMMYVQLQEAFGWAPFKKVFAEYRSLPRGSRPRSDADRRDQWMVRFSRTVGRNLGPFFQTWGVPTSEKARASIAKLPAWMPKDFQSK